MNSRLGLTGPKVLIQFPAGSLIHSQLHVQRHLELMAGGQVQRQQCQGTVGQQGTPWRVAHAALAMVNGVHNNCTPQKPAPTWLSSTVALLLLLIIVIIIIKGITPS
jgi:hypothetical protein